MIVAVLLILVLVTAAGVVLARGMSQPIVEMTQNMRQLAAGDLVIGIGSTDRADEIGEIGEMAGAMNVFKENAIKRRQAEDELARKEAQLRIAMDNTPGGMFMVDENLVIRVFNQQYKEMYDFPDGALQEGASLTELVRVRAERGDYGPGDPEELVEQRMQGYIEKMTLRHEERLPNGRVIELLRTPVEGGGVVGIATDITERKRAEEVLRQNQALFNQAARLASLGHWEWNEVEDRYTYCSDELARIHGVTIDEFVATWSGTDNDTKRAHPDDREEYAEAIRGMQEEAAAFDLEYRIVNPDGKIRYVREFGEPMLDDGGSPIGSFGTIQDITDRKRAEEELAQKEAQLRVALDNMPGGMKLVDKGRKYVLFNPQYSELHDFPDGLLKVGGSTLDEARFQAQRGDYGPGDIDELIEGVVTTYQTRKTVSYERTMANGRTLHFNYAPTPEGGYVTIATDITERKRAEQELAQKEAQLRVALDNMPGGMALFDRDLKFVLFNSQYCELFEYPDGLVRVGGSRRDALRHQADRGDFGPVDKDAMIEQLIAIDRRGEAVSRERTIAGSGRTLQIYTAPTPEGGSVSIYTDITERKRAEEALFEAKRRSEEASELVAEKNLMLESLSNQLSKYLSPQVYASIFAGKQSIEIASKRKKLTVFFSDIADFMGTTESLESEDLTNLLNHYLTEMSKIALDHGATIDKYVGDAIIAFFGDPETRGVKEDARTCVNMAIAMQRRMRELRSEWLDMGLERPFELRIGINTGFCTVGNFGSGDRMDYTIIGNEVNLAARLEALAEVGGILLAHDTSEPMKSPS